VSALQGRHADFWQVTSDALDFALETLQLEQAALRERLMNLYLTLAAFPEVANLLGRLKTPGLKTAIFSVRSEMPRATATRPSGRSPAPGCWQR
jgi:2-haloacid dehalogenase